MVREGSTTAFPRQRGESQLIFSWFYLRKCWIKTMQYVWWSKEHQSKERRKEEKKGIGVLPFCLFVFCVCFFILFCSFAFWFVVGYVLG